MRSPKVLATWLLLSALACSGGDGVTPEPNPPEITVTGVADGGVYDQPVTIVVTSSSGSVVAPAPSRPFKVCILVYQMRTLSPLLGAVRSSM